MRSNISRAILPVMAHDYIAGMAVGIILTWRLQRRFMRSALHGLDALEHSGRIMPGAGGERVALVIQSIRLSGGRLPTRGSVTLVFQSIFNRAQHDPTWPVATARNTPVCPQCSEV